MTEKQTPIDGKARLAMNRLYGYSSVQTTSTIVVLKSYFIKAASYSFVRNQLTLTINCRENVQIFTTQYPAYECITLHLIIIEIFKVYIGTT